MTINRGFLNLLNNDYYLDLKTTAINKVLDDNLLTHINDTNIHFPWEQVEELLENTLGLTKSTIVRIPLYSKEQTYGLSKIKQVINKIPRNLNNYTLVFEFCIPVSEAITYFDSISDISADSINYNDSSSNNYYKKYFKLSPADIEPADIVTTKRAPSNINVSTYFEKDLKSTYLAFDNFYGGTVIVYGNTEFFVDDVSETGEAIPETKLASVSSYDTNLTLKFLQEKIINPTVPSLDDNLITLKSTGINSKYSVMSLSNNYVDSYLYNIKLENTLKPNSTVEFKNYDFPELNDIIIYWPLKNNTKPQIINGDFLSQTETFEFNKQETVYTKVSSNNINVANNSSFENIEAITMNSTNVDPTLKNEVKKPGYIWLDSKSSNTVKTQSNYIKNIIYNKTNENPNTTMILWGYNATTDIDNPIFSDYNYLTESGIIISPEGLKVNPTNNNSVATATNDIGTFLSDFSEIQMQTLNNWVMYVIEFEHEGGLSVEQLKNMQPWTTYAESPDFKTISSKANKQQMRINVRAVYRDLENKIQIKLLLPTKKALQYLAANGDSTGITQFSVPAIDEFVNVNFFGTQNTKGDNLDSWSVWNGSARNIILFNKFFSEVQLANLYNALIFEYYDWLNIGEYEIIKKINKNSYLGSLYAANTKNLTVENSVFKQNAKTLETVTFISNENN